MTSVASNQSNQKTVVGWERESATLHLRFTLLLYFEWPVGTETIKKIKDVKNKISETNIKKTLSNSNGTARGTVTCWSSLLPERVREKLQVSYKIFIPLLALLKKLAWIWWLRGLVALYCGVVCSNTCSSVTSSQSTMLHIHSVAALLIRSCSSNIRLSINGNPFAFTICRLKQTQNSS